MKKWGIIGCAILTVLAVFAVNNPVEMKKTGEVLPPPTIMAPTDLRD